ncbi:serine hydrolase domain-containing protein [Synoicihabitans lomoniglobus]|uniref:Serine hydrolase n=1 Tax=Synoicihabitans lomoniglobus TaxID=2909285 RepID=A0AAE9ZWC2_9BACT|nr:beta-lactamase family protein [Opitutaceae bacterium LMO-M01]WED64616.1 serine hydrolase [Opitutaceae bacterium LMO-M01]
MMKPSPRLFPALRALVILILAAASSLVHGMDQVAPAEVGLSAERLRRLDTVFEDYVSAGRLPGAVVLVARHGKVAHLGTYGMSDIEQEVPLREDAIFRIASQTKALVSVGIMMLQEEGKLLIDDDLADYLPEFAQTTVAVANDNARYEVVPAQRKITLRDLLRHTSGYDYGNGPGRDMWRDAGMQGWYFADREEPIRDTIARIAPLPAAAQPGSKFVYGYNTDILGAVIEVASGQDLATFLRERILNPLGMSDTHFYLPETKRGRLATVYSATSDGSLERAPAPGHMTGQGHYVDGPRQSFSGGAGLLSTARDYAVFLQMLANQGVHEGHRILSRKTVELMTVNHLPEGVKFPWSDGTGFGLGFSVKLNIGAGGLPGSYGEFGWGGAYHSTYWVDPAEDLVVVYFTQVIPASGLDDHAKLRALIYAAIDD